MAFEELITWSDQEARPPWQKRRAVSKAVTGYIHEITTSKLAVDCHVEQGQVAMVLGQFEANPDRPDVFRFQRALLADDAAFVPGWAKCPNGR